MGPPPSLPQPDFLYVLPPSPSLNQPTPHPQSKPFRNARPSSKLVLLRSWDLWQLWLSTPISRLGVLSTRSCITLARQGSCPTLSVKIRSK